jgi:hypothetical protein
MRRRHRPVAAAAVLAAASLPLWPSAVGAGESYDEFNHAEHPFNTPGGTCKLLITSFRQGATVRAETYVETISGTCSTTRVSAGLVFLTEHGDTVSASSADDGPGSAVGAGGAVDLVRSDHGVTFTGGPSVSYTLTSK